MFAGVGVAAGWEVGRDSGGKELADAADVAVGCCCHHFVSRRGVVDAGFLQELDDFVVVGEGGDGEQRNLGAVDGFRVGAVAEQECDCVGAVGADGPDEWRLVHAVAPVDLSSVIEEEGRQIEVAERYGVIEGRAEVVGVVDAGSGSEEDLDGVDLANEGGGAEERLSARVTLVGIGTLSEEGFQGGGVVGSDGGNSWWVLRGLRVERGGGQEERDKRDVEWAHGVPED